MIELRPNAGQEVTDWITKRVGVTALSDCTNFGFYEEGELVGGVAFYEYRIQDIVFSGVMEKGSFNKTMLRTLFNYPFIQLDCHRITAYTETDNRQANLFLKRLGFKKEGTMREISERLKDIHIYGMLKKECTWL
jgi:RimJ/RimL family protein N-acetyltransferase